MYLRGIAKWYGLCDLSAKPGVEAREAVRGRLGADLVNRDEGLQPDQDFTFGPGRLSPPPEDRYNLKRIGSINLSFIGNSAAAEDASAVTSTISRRAEQRASKLRVSTSSLPLVN